MTSASDSSSAPAVPFAEITVEFELTEREFLKCYMRIYRKRWIGTMGWHLTGAALLFTEGLLSNHPSHVGAAAVLAFFGLSAPFHTQYSFREHYKNYKSSFGHVRMIFNGEGMNQESWQGRLLIYWRSLSHFVEAPDAFIIFRGPTEAYPIPKRVLDADSGISQLREMLAKMIGRTTYLPEQPAFPVEPTRPTAN